MSTNDQQEKYHKQDSSYIAAIIFVSIGHKNSYISFLKRPILQIAANLHILICMDNNSVVFFLPGNYLDVFWMIIPVKHKSMMTKWIEITLNTL